MSDETSKQQQRQSTAASRRRNAEQAQADEAEAAKAAAAATGNDDASGDGEAEPGSDDAPEQAAAATGDQDKFPKDTLIARAPALLGTSKALASAVLRDADDEITITAAKARITKYLNAPVTATKDEEE